MKKNIITLFIFFMLPTINLYSNFRCIMDGNLDFKGDTLKFYMYHKRASDPSKDSDILMITSEDKIIIKQLHSNFTKFYTPLSTGLDWKAPLKYFISERELYVHPTFGIPGYADRVYVYGDSSIAQIIGVADNPKITKNFNIDVIPNIGNSTISSAIVARTREEYHGINMDRILYFVTDNSVVKIINDSIVVNVPLPDELIPKTPQKTNLLYYPLYTPWDYDNMDSARAAMAYLNPTFMDSTLVITRNDDGVIGFYNLYTQEIKTFNYKNLPLGEKFKIIRTTVFVSIDPNVSEPSNSVEYYDVDIGFFVLDSSDFKILVYNMKNKAWRIVNIGYPSNSAVYNKSVYPEIDSVFNWPYSSHEIAVSFKVDPTVIHDVHSVVTNQGSNVRSLCIYDFQTKGWTDFLIPLEVFKGYTPDMDYMLRPKQINWYRKEHNTIGILYDHFLIEYDPSNSTIRDASLTKDINVYPNPIARNSTVNIMCYVQDLNKIDIGLYDVIGRKILDLNNNYEYNPTTHTITTTIEVPIGTPSGTYYLNVRNGSEFKTRAVVIEK